MRKMSKEPNASWKAVMVYDNGSRGPHEEDEQVACDEEATWREATTEAQPRVATRVQEEAPETKVIPAAAAPCCIILHGLVAKQPPRPAVEAVPLPSRPVNADLESRCFDVDDGSATGSMAPCVASSGDSLTTSSSPSPAPAASSLPPETEPVPAGWSDAAGSALAAGFGLRPHAEQMDDVSAMVAATHATKKTTRRRSVTRTWPGGWPEPGSVGKPNLGFQRLAQGGHAPNLLQPTKHLFFGPSEPWLHVDCNQTPCNYVTFLDICRRIYLTL